jgi:hypothetical protein
MPTTHSKDEDYAYDPEPTGQWPADALPTSGVSWNEAEHEHTVELDGREVTATYPRLGTALDKENVTKVYREDI